MDGILPYIDAFIALLGTLYGFALFVTLLVELGHRLVGVDAKRLGMFLVQFITDEQARKTEAGTALSAIGQNIRQLLDPAVPIPVSTPPPANPGIPATPQAPTKPTLGLWRRIKGDLLEKLEWSSFVQEARKYEAWREFEKSMAAGPKEALQEELRRLELGYNELCGRMKTVWGRYARGIAFAVGIVLALALNLNALKVFDFYLHHPEATQATIEHLQGLEGEITKLQDKKCLDTAPVADAAAAQSCADSVRDLFTDVRSSLALVKSETQYQIATGIPLGWHGGAAWPWDWRIDLDLLAVLATGLLLGLGAPQLHGLLQAVLALRGGKATPPPPEV